MSDLMLMIGGSPVPLSDVAWEGVGSCGCPFGWTVAEAHTGEVYASTPEQAKAQLFGENATSLKYYESSGATVRPILRGDIPRGDKCAHAPRYGLPDADPPEGHEWATTDGHWGRMSHKRHIVPMLAMGDEGWRARLDAKAICGSRTPRSRSWDSDRTDRFADVRGKVPCSKCIKEAQR